MKKVSKALSMLKRNFYGTLILGLLLPIIASEILETDPTTAALIGGALIWISIINLSYAKKVEKEVESLDSSDFEAFTIWLDNYSAKRWDAQFEQDVGEGELDKLGKKADLAFESGLCTEL